MFASPIRPLIRPALWLGFFAFILWAWWFLYQMAMSMDLDLIGRPGPMGRAMADMDPRMDMYMPMAEFGPLFAMWAVMMAAGSSDEASTCGPATTPTVRPMRPTGASTAPRARIGVRLAESSKKPPTVSRTPKLIAKKTELKGCVPSVH